MNPLDPLYKVRLENALLEQQLAESKRSRFLKASWWANIASIATLVVAVATIIWTMASGIVDMRVERIGLQTDRMEARKDTLTKQIDAKVHELDSLTTLVKRKNEVIAGRMDELADVRGRYASLKKEKAQNEARLLFMIDTMRRNMPSFDEYKARFIRDEELNLLRTAVNVCDQSKDPRYGSSLAEFIDAQFFHGRSLDMDLSFCRDMRLQELVQMLEERTPELPK